MSNADEQTAESSGSSMADHLKRYRDYINDLKSGQSSGISAAFGRATDLLPPEVMEIKAPRINKAPDQPLGLGDQALADHYDKNYLRQTVETMVQTYANDLEDLVGCAVLTSTGSEEVLSVYLENGERMFMLSDLSVIDEETFHRSLVRPDVGDDQSDNLPPGTSDYSEELESDSTLDGSTSDDSEEDKSVSSETGKTSDGLEEHEPVSSQTRKTSDGLEEHESGKSQTAGTSDDWEEPNSASSPDGTPLDKSNEDLEDDEDDEDDEEDDDEEQDDDDWGTLLDELSSDDWNDSLNGVQASTFGALNQLVTSPDGTVLWRVYYVNDGPELVSMADGSIIKRAEGRSEYVFSRFSAMEGDVKYFILSGLVVDPSTGNVYLEANEGAYTAAFFNNGWRVHQYRNHEGEETYYATEPAKPNSAAITSQVANLKFDLTTGEVSYDTMDSAASVTLKSRKL